ncbi:MAG: cytidylate kinase family protein [Oscillospiraceae bacterium]|nr:cytidylate kinase family protein [Oscillospiraceae bacterium]
MFISITGNLGSGKSTVCAYLRETYNAIIYSTGRIHRDIAQRMGKSTLEMNLLMKDDHSYDHMIDDEVVELSKKRHPSVVVFDSRMAWHFAVKSFKVFLSADADVAAERVYHASRGKEEVYASLEDAKAKLAARAEAERERFKLIYGVDYTDPANFDLIADTSARTPEEVAELVYSEALRYYRDAGPA